VDRLPPGEVCVISTGSQGEPLSALALMAAGESKWLHVRPDDVIVISAHPVPGNEWAVGKVIDGLHRRGATVVHTGVEPVHVSGHARQGELQTLLSVARPQWFVPVHGEYRHLVNHARLATAMGVAEDHVLLCEDGDSIVLDDRGVHRGDPVSAGFLYVDGTVGDVEHGVLRDRRVLAEEGVVVVVATVDQRAAEVVGNPEIVTRGWVHAPEAEALIEEASATVRKELEVALSEGTAEHELLCRHARRALGRFVGERTRRRPMIVPVVVLV
jgi:ribonuclease J